MNGGLTNSVSLIAAVWNEMPILPQWINMLFDKKEGSIEIIVVDGGSTDGSWEWLQDQKKIKIFQSDNGRTNQFHYGAQKAIGSILYFVHVDTVLPQGFDILLKKARTQNYMAGCFRMYFSPSNPIGLRIASWGTRFNHLLFRGGDQTLFIDKKLYQFIGGFDPAYQVCEDINLIKKIYQQTFFKILPQYVTTDSRRFTKKGTVYLLFHFRVLHLLHWLGFGPKNLLNYYKTFIN